MKKTAKYSVLLVFTFVVRVWPINPGAGTTLFPVLSMTFDARAGAMAGVSVAMPNGVYGIVNNPAVLGYIERNEIALGYRSVVLDIWGSPLYLARNIGKYGTIGGGVTNLSEGAVRAIDADKNVTGDIWRANSLVGFVSIGRVVWDRLSLGASIKGVYHYIGTAGEHVSADGFAADIGLQYRQMHSRLIFGASLKNIGFLRSGYSEEKEDNRFPVTVIGGISYVPKYVSSVRVALDIDKKAGDYLNFRPALEVDVYKRYLVLRGGYCFSMNDLQDRVNKLILQSDITEQYQKTNWLTFTLGVGVNAEYRDIPISLDTGIEFHTDISQPSVLITTRIQI
jgi:hypothetical protein